MINVFIDGASRGNPGLSGIGIVVFNNDERIKEIYKFIGRKTNNEAEYIAIIKALEYLSEAGIKEANLFMDSELVVRQLNGIYMVKSVSLKPLYEKAVNLLKSGGYNLMWIPRNDNSLADELANKAIDERSVIGKDSSVKSIDDSSFSDDYYADVSEIEFKKFVEYSFFGKVNCLKVVGSSKGFFLEFGLKDSVHKNRSWKKVKLSVIELGEILVLFREKEKKISFFHKFNDNKSIIYINKGLEKVNFRIGRFSKNLSLGEFEVFRVIIEKYIGSLISC